MPWRGFPVAMDLTNTIVMSVPEVDLLTTEEELAAWTAAETGRVPDVEATSGHLDEVRELRSHVRAALFAAAEGRALPPEAVLALNQASAQAPSYPVLGPNGLAQELFLPEDPFIRLRAVVARSAIAVIAGDDRDRLDVCRAPSCGMLFLRRGAVQKWCSDPCGNRSRVARHAQRRR